MKTRTLHDQNLEKHMDKQMGCMTGFFQLFDRHQLLAGKRLHTTKRLPPPAIDSSSETDKSVGSPAISRELATPPSLRSIPCPSPDRFKPSPLMDIRSPGPDTVVSPEMPPKSPLPLPIFEIKEGTRSSWKFCKEAPRLSLDSRAIVDAKGSLQPREIRTNASIVTSNRSDNDGNAGDGDDKQRRSPSVIARLMGLEQLPHSNSEPMKNAELRRSASESRVSRDLSQYRIVEGNNFQLQQPHSLKAKTSNAIRDNAAIGHNNSKSNARNVDPMECLSRNLKSEQGRTMNRGLGATPLKSSHQRKSFFDSADVFPEPKQTMSIYGEIEKRLRMRGIDEPPKDLETLKHILEALQLKGLLHSKSPPNRNNKNFVYDQPFSSDESPIVVMKPWKSSMSPVKRRIGNDSPPSSFRSNSTIRRNYNLACESLPPVVSRHERTNIVQNARSPTRNRNSRSPTRNENDVKSTNSLIKKKASSIETQRRVNEPTENRRVSPISSPKLTPRRNGSDQTSPNRIARNNKSSAEIYSNAKNTNNTNVTTEDESSSISESTVSTSSQTDTERSKIEEYKGRSLLERCDKLLHSIAEMTATELQPSPVSVLDSSFYKDESFSPSPVLKRSISFQGESEEDIWIPVSPIETREENLVDCDFNYISEILRASNYLPEDCDVFLLLEKQQYLKGKSTSKVSTLQRKLIFDTITEIQDWNRQLPPWKVVEKSSPQQIWCEFQRIQQQHYRADDLFEIICGILKKDLARDAVNGWGSDCLNEMSEAVLYIERLIFKDLIDESIRDLGELVGKTKVLGLPRRKLVF